MTQGLADPGGLSPLAGVLMGTAPLSLTWEPFQMQKTGAKG